MGPFISHPSLYTKLSLSELILFYLNGCDYFVNIFLLLLFLRSWNFTKKKKKNWSVPCLSVYCFLLSPGKCSDINYRNKLQTIYIWFWPGCLQENKSHMFRNESPGFYFWLPCRYLHLVLAHGVFLCISGKGQQGRLCSETSEHSSFCRWGYFWGAG